MGSVISRDKCNSDISLEITICKALNQNELAIHEERMKTEFTFASATLDDRGI